MSEMVSRISGRFPRLIRRADPAVVTAFGCILLLLLLGSLYSSNFLSLDYLLQQLKVASFLGVIAAGMMLVILLGHIDLSIPWVMTAGPNPAAKIPPCRPPSILARRRWWRA